MIDPADIQLEKNPTPSFSSPPRRSTTPWLMAGLAVLAAAGAIWFFLFRSGAQPPAPETAASPAAAAPLVAAHTPGAVCAAAEGIALPPLDESDGFAGVLATSLSQHPSVVAWLATDDMIRRFVTVVDAVATGKSPAPQLRALRPAGTFRTSNRAGGLIIDPRHYQRYAPVVAAIESVDAAAAARVCSGLRLRLDDAYAELKRGDAFDQALERAIVSLLQTPALGADVRLVPAGAKYEFEDAALEELTPAQKHLARMGVNHMRIVQDKLRQIALAIGIPRERLPQ